MGEAVGLVMNGMSLTSDSISSSVNMELQKRQQALAEASHKLDLQSQYDMNKLGILQEQANVSSYDKWLANYGAQYKQETDSKLWSGRETYENFLNAIGYSDALAGATGRIGGATSVGEVTKSFDKKLVDFVGEDRTLNANGGVFGQELSQLQLDLDFQRQEMEWNRDISRQAIEGYEKANSDIDEFIKKNFSTDWAPNTNASRYALSALTGNLSEFFGFGDKATKDIGWTEFLTGGASLLKNPINNTINIDNKLKKMKFW